MKILITGTTQGIGKAIAEHFLQEGHTVWGIDRQKGSIEHPCYMHVLCDVRDKDHLPTIDDVEILINNAGRVADATHPALQSVKKILFDRLTEVNKAVKTSNSTPKCMRILEWGELRSKSKHLAKQALLGLRIATPVCELARNDTVI